MTPEEYVTHRLAEWPPLSDDQLDRIEVLLRASPDGSEHEDAQADPMEQAS